MCSPGDFLLLTGGFSTSILLLATEGEALCVERDNSERALRNELPSHLKDLPSEGKEGEISADLAGGF